MKRYTKEHLWIDGNRIGITAKGDELMGGITFIEVLPQVISVEGTKNVVDMPVKATAVLRSGTDGSWPGEDKPVAYLSGNGEWTGETMSEAEYAKYCETM